MNAKQFAGYEVTKGFHCGGESIKSWDDKTSTNYGKVTGVFNCEEICNKHVECAGFVYRLDKDVCGHWKRAPLTPYKSKIDNCYQKVKGMYILYGKIG